MGEGQPWVLVRAALILADFGSYGFKEWLAILASAFGIGGSIFGLWKALRYSKAQIAARLGEYLADEEERHKASRERIIRHLRLGSPLDGNFEHESYQRMKEAIADQAGGHVQRAGRVLDSVAAQLLNDVKVGQKFVSNANLQLATALMIRGKGASARGEYAPARNGWKEALKIYPNDAEVERYLGELALTDGDIDGALDHFNRAYAFAPDDKLLKAETSENVADFYRDRGPMRSELRALATSAPIYAAVGYNKRAGVTYMRAGELAAQLRHRREAPELFRAAFTSFSNCSDHVGMAAAHKNLENLGEDVSGLVLPGRKKGFQPYWSQIRCAAEAAILAVAAALFYLSLR